ncbi:MAG: glycosyl hydrolase family 28 protein [Bacteroidota bacterium]
MRNFFAVLAMYATTISVSGQNFIYNVKELVPETNREQVITKELQALIDKCHAEGGGQVYFPAGEYLTGPIILKSNVYLYLSAGATLYGSTDINDYTEETNKSLIYAKSANNFGIIGNGTLNGQGDFFWRDKPRPYNRPWRFVLFEECTNIKVKDISMLNSPNWNLELLRCKFAWIDGVTMISDIDSPNTDGIDPTSSSNIFISNCYFELGDDAICPKSRGDIPTENIVVQNCIIKSDDSAIKLGTRSEAPIRNLLFSNIMIRDTQYGIAFFAKDGGVFENIRFSNITIESALNNDGKSDRPSGSYPIFMDIERRKPTGPITPIRNIHFSDITINTTDGHCLFLGQPDLYIEDISLNNINYYLEKHRTFEGSMKPRGVRSLTHKDVNDYSDVPSNFTFAYINGLSIDNLNIIDGDKSDEHERHMIWGYCLKDVEIKGFSNKLAQPNTKLSQIMFKEVEDVRITSSKPYTTLTPFLEVTGQSSKNIAVVSNDLGKIENAVELDEKINKEELKMNANLK